MDSSSLRSEKWAAMLGYATSETLSAMRDEGWEIAQVRRLPTEDVSIFWAVDLWKGQDFTNLTVLDDAAMRDLAESYSRVPLLDAA